MEDNYSTSTGIANYGGGGIYNAGSLTVLRSLVAGNSQQQRRRHLQLRTASLSISNSTLANNTATSQGGALWSQAPTGTLEQSTLAGNSAAAGGGLYLAAALTVKGTILANNTGGNCAGTAPTNGGYNLDSAATCGFGTASGSQSSTDPMLGPLADNGGPTLTFEPALDSPAINAGDPAYVAPSGDTDQRGLPRVRGRADRHRRGGDPAACQATHDNGTTVYRSGDASAVQQAIDAAPSGGYGQGCGHFRVWRTTGNQVAYIHNKSLTLEGGYDPTDWDRGPQIRRHTLQHSMLPAPRMGWSFGASGDNASSNHPALSDDYRRIRRPLADGGGGRGRAGGNADAHD